MFNVIETELVNTHIHTKPIFQGINQNNYTYNKMRFLIRYAYNGICLRTMKMCFTYSQNIPYFLQYVLITVLCEMDVYELFNLHWMLTKRNIYYPLIILCCKDI